MLIQSRLRLGKIRIAPLKTCPYRRGYGTHRDIRKQAPLLNKGADLGRSAPVASPMPREKTFRHGLGGQPHQPLTDCAPPAPPGTAESSG